MSAGELRGRKPARTSSATAWRCWRPRSVTSCNTGSAPPGGSGKEAGVGPCTGAPTVKRCWLLCCRRSDELEARRDIDQLGDPAEALERWLRAMEKCFSSFGGLPDPLARPGRRSRTIRSRFPARHPHRDTGDACEPHLARRVACARRCGGHDLFLAACSVAWIKGSTEESRSTGSTRSSPAATRAIQA
ncbi:TetR/AcrR family transcriptional regulator [Streptomyces thinghirensis]|nr:TetR/AcrR family transcriptional regulator [Streptomyces thinghirensis]